MSDPIVPASGPISFTKLKEVFGTINTSTVKLSLTDINKTSLGDIGQPEQNEVFSITSLRNKSLPDPIVTASLYTAFESSQFEQGDTIVNMGSIYNFKKRIITRFTLNLSTFNINRTVHDRGIFVQYNNDPTREYGIISDGIFNSNAAKPSAPSSVSDISKIVPYKVLVVKRNGLVKSVNEGSVDVNDTFENRTSLFNISVSTDNQTYQSNHAFNHQIPFTQTWSHNWDHNYPHQKYGQHSTRTHRGTHSGTHYRAHHNIGQAPWQQQFQHSSATLQSTNNGFADVQIANVFQIGAQYTGTCAVQGTTAQARGNNGCTTKYRLSLKPSWTTTTYSSQNETSTIALSSVFDQHTLQYQHQATS